MSDGQTAVCDNADGWMTPVNCPSCSAVMDVSQEIFFGDAQCHTCNRGICYLNAPNETHVFPLEGNQALREEVIARIAEQLQAPVSEVVDNPHLLDDYGLDSLQILQLLVQLEEEIGVSK
ncbi:MAG: phosphopantetheine-binding protein [Planctomycetota bacterium]